MPLSEIKQKHVWLLSEMMAMPSGDYRVHHRTRAPRRTPTAEELDAQIDALKEANVEMVWVTRKYPLLVFLIPALLPLVSAWRSNGVVHAPYWSLRSILPFAQRSLDEVPCNCISCEMRLSSISRIATHAYLAS